MTGQGRDGDLLNYGTAKELTAALAARKISSLELTDHVIARIEALDGKLNAVVVRDFDRAREAARRADAALARGERGPLLGIPMTVKESFNVAGLPTTWGVPDVQGLDSARRTRSRSRACKAAGAVILGKTNVPFLLGDWQSYNDIYGTTNNPWDLGRTPGGSSGGSSAALAAGFGPLSLGSDIGGSLRTPAHYCGVYAHKPTLSLVPPRGHRVPGTVLRVERSGRGRADGAQRRRSRVWRSTITAGPDQARDGIAYRLALPAPRHERLKDFRVLVIDEHPLLPTADDSARRARALGGAAGQSGRQGRAYEPAAARSRGVADGSTCAS